MDRSSFGVVLFSGNKWISDPLNLNSNNNRIMINAIDIDKKQRVWLGGKGELFMIEGSSVMCYNNENSLIQPDYLITDIALDSASGVWLSTYENGVIHFDGLNWFEYNVKILILLIIMLIT